MGLNARATGLRSPNGTKMYAAQTTGRDPVEPTDIARCMNVIATFTGLRDVDAVSRDALREVGLPEGRADVAVLTGGAILAGADVMACAMRAGVARTYALVGGIGHTTAAFRDSVHRLWPAAEFPDNASEAEVFDAYLRSRHGLAADVLETHSTNSGNNVSFLFELLRARGVEPRSLFVIQDATMQRRLDAVVRLQEPQVRVVNYAAYRAEVIVREGGRDGAGHGASDAPGKTSLGQLGYATAPFGMWDIDYYLRLLMGEIPRLADAPEGYGPRGEGLIAHVEIPAEVQAAFEALAREFPDHVRKANPAFLHARE